MSIEEAISSLLEIVDLLIHVVGGLYHLGVGFVRALADNQIHEFLDDADVGLFDIAQRLVAAIAPHVRLVIDESLIRPVEVPVSCGSYDKLRRATKWRPEITLDTSLHDVIEEMRRRRGES